MPPHVKFLITQEGTSPLPYNPSWFEVTHLYIAFHLSRLPPPPPFRPQVPSPPPPPLCLAPSRFLFQVMNPRMGRGDQEDNVPFFPGFVNRLQIESLRNATKPKAFLCYGVMKARPESPNGNRRVLSFLLRGHPTTEVCYVLG